MDRRQKRQYQESLLRDAESPANDARYGLDDAQLDGPTPVRCAGSKFGRHRFVDREGRLVCEFCTQPRLATKIKST